MFVPPLNSCVVNCRNLSSGQTLATVHGAVLALAASVLSAPYDMPGYALILEHLFCNVFGTAKLVNLNK